MPTEREGEPQQPQNKAGSGLTAGGAGLWTAALCRAGRPQRPLRDLRQGLLGLVSLFLPVKWVWGRGRGKLDEPCRISHLSPIINL